MRRWLHAFSMADLRLQTPRLLLRGWREDDEAAWLAHLNTAQVKRHLGGPQSAEAMHERFVKMLAGPEEQGLSFLAMERRADGAFLGTCGLGRITTGNPPQQVLGAVQIGWQLRSDCWGHGYATEAATAVLDHGFGPLGLPCIFAQTSEANAASWRVMQRLGMERRSECDYVDPDYSPEENPTMVWSINTQKWSARP